MDEFLKFPFKFKLFLRSFNSSTCSSVTEDQIAVKEYIKYLVRYVFITANVSDEQFCIKYDLMPMLLHFEQNRINKICRKNVSMTQKY